MNDLKFKTKSGEMVVLSVEDMVYVSNQYRRGCITEYLDENYSIPDEDMAGVIEKVVEFEDDYQMTEEEAISQAISWLAGLLK